MKTLILSDFGTNCEKETLYACHRAGGEDVDLRHINVIYHEGLDLAQYHLLILIGGFLDGDDLGGARACANRFRFRALPQGLARLRRPESLVGPHGGVVRATAALPRATWTPSVTARAVISLSWIPRQTCLRPGMWQS